MEKRNNQTGRIIVTIILCVAGILLFGFCFGYIQSRTALNQIEEEMKANSKDVKEAYLEAEENLLYLNLNTDDYMEHVLNLLQYQASNDQTFEISDAYLLKQNNIPSFKELLIIDKDGRIKASTGSPSEEFLDDVYNSEVCDSLYETFATGNMAKAITPNVIIPFGTEDETREGTSELITESDAGMTSETELIIASTEGSTEEIDDQADLNGYTQATEDYYLYALAYDEDHAFVIGDTNYTTQYLAQMMNPWKYILEKETIGAEGFVFAWSAENNEILYYPKESLIGQNVSALGLNLDRIVSGKFVWQKVNGKKMYLYPSYFKEKKAWVVCACEEASIFRTHRMVFFSMWIIFGGLAAVLTYYEILLLKSREVVTEIHAYSVAKKDDLFKNRKVRLLIFTLFSVILIFLSSFYLQTLYKMSDWAKRSNKTIAAGEEVLAEGAEFLQRYPAEYKRMQENLGRMAGAFLEDNPDQITISVMNELVKRLSMVEMKVTDPDGNVKAASSYSPLRQIADALEIEDGVSDETLKEGTKETSRTVSIFEVLLSDSEDKVMGNLRVSYLTRLADMVLEKQSVGAVLSRVQPGEGSFLFAINKESGQVTYHPNVTSIGQTIDEFGLDKKYLKEDLCSVISFNRTPYYVLSGGGDEELIFVVISEEDLLAERTPLSIAATIAAGIIMLLIGMVLYLQKEELEHVVREVDRSDRYGMDTPEYKAFSVLILFGIAVAAIAAIYSIWNRSGNTGSVLDYVLNGNWEPGLNAFALTSALVKISIGGLLIILIKKLSYLLSGILPIRAGTIVRMLTSLLTYGAAFFIVYLCCVDFGMPTTALMASAGVVSVVIGIGANSLVGDNIAGMFMLMEGHIQVGDTIEVGGFTGIVQELGIRVTKLYYPVDDIVKIIPNREVNNVIHRSMYPARITTLYLIEYSEDLERVETLLREELDKMTGKVEGLIGTPEYLGVHALGDHGVLLKVRFLGREMDRLILEREVNRRIYMMFVQNNINVPYPQLTLHPGQDMPVDEKIWEKIKGQMEKSGTNKTPEK